MDEALHRKRMKRIDRVGDVRFVTFSCYQRLPLLGHPRIRDAFVDTVGQHRDRTGIRVLGYVVMPEHVHLLLLPPPKSPVIAPFLHGVKYTIAQRVIKRWKGTDAAVLRSLVDIDGGHRFWQRGGGYDRNICGDEEFAEKLNYMHMNPVARELVKSPLEWAWSSAVWFSGRRGEALIRIDEI